MTTDAPTPRTCCVRGSTDVSRVMGKRLCQQIPRYEYCGRWYCAKHAVHGQLAECRSRIAALQAKIDSLMLEYCPGEMTPEQIENWGRHQKAVSLETDAAIDAARKGKP